MLRRRATPMAIGFAALLSACAVDIYDVSYTSVFEARAHEADERGWIPEWLPEGSVQIQQRHQGREADTILRATLPADADLSAFCTADAPSPPAVPLTADWFDLVGIPDAALACDDDWYAVVSGDQLQMWRAPAL